MRLAGGSTALIDQYIDYFGESPYHAADDDDVRDAALSFSC